MPARDEHGGLPPSFSHANVTEAERKALRSLELKVGAQVVLTVNRPSLGLVNGSRGVVVGLQRDCAVSEGDKEAFGVAAGKYDVPVVRFDDGKTRAVKPSQFFQGVLNESATALFPNLVETAHRWAQYWR